MTRIPTQYDWIYSLYIKEQIDQQKQAEQNKDFYVDNQGRLVMTQHYHLKRGYCCDNGCLHCPYKS